MSLSPPAETVEGVPGPLSVPATLAMAVRLYGRDLGRLWLAMATIIVPLLAVGWLLDIDLVPAGTVLAHGTIEFAQTTSGRLRTFTLVDDLIEVLLTLLSTGVAYRILLGRYLRHPADLGTSLRFALERAWKLLAVSALTIVFIFVGIILLLIPGIYAAIVLALAIPVAMAENLGVLDTLARSRELLAGQWARALACLLAGPVLVAAIGVAVTDLLAPALIRALTPGSVDGALATLGALHAILGILFAPYGAAVPIVLYVDMLLRRRDPQLPALLA